MMKRLLLLFLILVTQMVLGQKNYRITEGELQFIHPKKRIILKKGNEFLELKVFPDTDDGQFVFETKTNTISRDEFEKLIHDSGNVHPKDITQNYNFEKLKDIKFVSNENDEYGEYEFSRFNDEIFVVNQFDYDEALNGLGIIECDDYYKYCFLDFGQGRKVLMTFESHDSFVIPVKNSVVFLGDWRFDQYKIVKKEALAYKEVLFPLKSFNKDELYRVDTLKNHQVKLVNYYHKTVIDKSFDSIVLGHVTVGYRGKNIELYDYQFKKMDYDNIRVVKYIKSLSYYQFIENNKLKEIRADGKPLLLNNEKIHNYNFFDDDRSPIPTWLEISHDSLKVAYNKPYQAKLINNENIDTFCFLSNENDDYVTLRSNDIKEVEKQLIYYLDKDGKYGINYLGYFINPDFTEPIFDYYQGLQSLKTYYSRNIKLQKNNLFMYYPLQKMFRYKSLEDFNGSFARFELPNGQKGWLCSDGKEYLDE